MSSSSDSTATHDPTAPWFAGADGYPNGWVVVLWQPATETVRWRTVPDVEALLALPETPKMLGVDMVIGLPDTASPGGRACDRAARQLLGRPRGSSVFSPPVYDTLEAASYEEANRINRASGPEAPGLSLQTYYLIPKMRSVAEHMTPDLQAWVREVHPECAFYAMNDDAPVVASKHDMDGLDRRLDLLRAAGFPRVEETVDTLTGGRVTADDVLDAHAACWTARRIAGDRAERCPPVGEVAPTNARGIRMEIWR